MAPAKADMEFLVESNKRKESEDKALSSMTSSLTCLTLHTDSHKDLAGLEAGFSQISLGEKLVQVEDLEKQVEQEEEKEKQVEQKGEKEKQVEQEEEKEKQVEQEEEKDKRDKEGERDSEEEEDNEKRIRAVKEIKISCESKKLADSEVFQESKESEYGKEEEEEEEEEKKKEEEEDEVKESEGKLQDKFEFKEEEEEKEVVSDDEDVTKDKEEYTKEEKVSDSENPTGGDDQNIQPQPKDRKLRSRGFGHVIGQNYMNYMGAEAYQQQQQQQQRQHQQQYPQNQMWSQPHQYPAIHIRSEDLGLKEKNTEQLWVPQHVQEGGYAGSSPTGALGEWHGSTQLDALSGKTFIPSLGEYSPVSCTSGEDDMSSVSCGYNAESLLGYQDTMHINSPQYQESQPSPYQQDLSHNSQYQDCQPVLYHQQQDNQASSFHQRIQYQESQATSYYQGSPQILSPQSYQESPSPVQILTTSHSSQSQGPHSSYLTPPVSPQPTTSPTSVSHSEDDIEEIMNFVLEEDPLEISHHDSTIDSIIRNLLEIRNGCHHKLEEVLDKDVLDLHIKGFAKMKNEDLIKGDEDGDIFYTRILCTGQMELDYNEKIVACTKRVEKMDLCCNSVVDWHVKQCQRCGNSDPKTFYSPLSWRNNLDEMPLSNLVLLQFPPIVVEYLTRKVMQRPMDFKRTFVKNYELFCGETKVYKCLLEGLKSLQSA